MTTSQNLFKYQKHDDRVSSLPMGCRRYLQYPLWGQVPTMRISISSLVAYREPNLYHASKGRNSLSDSLSRLWNAYQRSFEEESIPFSVTNQELLSSFTDAGYISGWDHVKGLKGSESLRIYLKYYQGRPAIHGILQISKPGKRIYLSKKKILKISESQSWGNTKTLFVGTSQGIQTHRQILSISTKCSSRGGEAYCLVW